MNTFTHYFLNVTISHFIMNTQLKKKERALNGLPVVVLNQHNVCVGGQ